jgi:hypothetical protein
MFLLDGLELSAEVKTMIPARLVCTAILAATFLPWAMCFAQDVVPPPGEAPVVRPLSPSGDSGAAAEEPQCSLGYSIVTCSGENAKFAQAFDWLLLVMLPLFFVLLFVYLGPVFLARRYWWATKPWMRLGISFGAGLVFAALLLFMAPFVPQASPIRLEVGPINWILDGRFVEACRPCRDGVTNPGLFFGRITWLMPPHGLIPENPVVLMVLPFVFLIVWFLLGVGVFFLLRKLTGLESVK